VRDKSTLYINGVSSVSDGDDGKVLEVKVEGGRTMQIELSGAGARGFGDEER